MQQQVEHSIKSFLKYCLYNSINPKVRLFLRFYGIDKVQNYDLYDFNLYVELLMRLENGVAATYIDGNNYPLP